jgi:hypothetical protein
VGEDRRHGLAVDRRHVAIGLGGEEAEKLALALLGVLLRPTYRVPGAPDTGEGEQREIFAEREPGPSACGRVAGSALSVGSAKAVTGTRQRNSGVSQCRQCGELTLRMFVTPRFGRESGSEAWLREAFAGLS